MSPDRSGARTAVPEWRDGELVGMCGEGVPVPVVYQSGMPYLVYLTPDVAGSILAIDFFNSLATRVDWP